MKSLLNPIQVYSSQQRHNGEPAVYLVSHTRSLHTENKVGLFICWTFVKSLRQGRFTLHNICLKLSHAT
jgi:hypothetical protein